MGNGNKQKYGNIRITRVECEGDPRLIVQYQPVSVRADSGFGQVVQESLPATGVEWILRLAALLDLPETDQHQILLALRQRPALEECDL